MIETFDYDRETRKQSLRRKISESPSQKDNFLQHCAPSVHRVRVSTLSSNITVTSWCLWGKTLVAKISDVTRQQLGDPSQHCTSFFGATSITAHSSSSPDSPSWMKSRCLSHSFVWKLCEIYIYILYIYIFFFKKQTGCLCSDSEEFGKRKLLHQHTESLSNHFVLAHGLAKCCQ